MKTIQTVLLTIFFISCLGINQASSQGKDAYKVVINHEEQYAIWIHDMKVNDEWTATKIKGTLAACQKYIDEVWTDMRPLSVQKMNLADDAIYSVVINHEEQYSIWPREVETPEGWKQLKKHGSLKNCTKYIRKVWTDMRPLNQRKPGVVYEVETTITK